MKEYAITERVKKFREYVKKSMTDHEIIWGMYGWDYRQRYEYLKGWVKHCDSDSEQTITPTLQLRRSMANVYMMDHLGIFIRPEDEILGLPDVEGLNEQEKIEYEALEKAYSDMGPRTVGRLDHMSPNYDKLLRVGIKGLLEEIHFRRNQLTDEVMADYVEKCEYYDMCELELNALLRLAERYAQKARAMGMEEAAQRLERVPQGPAQSFHDALQSVHFFSFNLRGLYPFGRPDQSLIRFYREDIAAGRLTEERALELIDQFNLLYTLYTRPKASISYMIGGKSEDGQLVENELTWLLLQSIRHTAMPYPSVGLAVNKGTSDAILAYAMRNLAQGLTHPALFNDEEITQALIRSGKPASHARNYVHSSCVEITPCGRSGVWVTSPYYNCPQILLSVLKNGFEGDSVEALLTAFQKELEKRVKEGQHFQNLWQLERRRNGGESILVSCLMDDCLKRGKSIDEGGAIYNEVMPDFVGVSNVIDSIAAINQLVFREKRLSIKSYINMIENNYQNNEAIRKTIINRCPHFGNNEPETNSLAVRLYGMIEDACRGLVTFRSSRVFPGAFSFYMHEEFGKETLATPDGRFSSEALNAGADPVSGRDTHGVTSTILSMTQWDAHAFLGGVANNLNLNFSDLSDEKIENACALVRVYMERGGVELQVSCVTCETLEDAMIHPERHGDLMVRIGGYSDFYTLQSKELQKEILERTRHGVN